MTEQPTDSEDAPLLFGSFQLFCVRKELWDSGRRVPVGGRAIDILVALVENAGQILDKNALTSIAWPHTSVDESNLRVHIARLRKALGRARDGRPYIVNVPVRGYSFVANVTRAHQVPGLQLSTMRNPCPVNAHLPLVIGRTELVDALVDRFAISRFITVVGPAGVGKSTVTAATVRFLAVRKAYPICLIQLSLIDDPDELAPAVATALGISIAAENPIGGIVSFLADQRLVLSFDNGEHLISALAPLIARIMAEAPGVDVVVSSREPLRIDMEWVHRLGPLDLPDEATLDPLSSPAVQLFVERASTILGSGELDPRDLDASAEICRRLDGLPLAIELVAGHVEMFGIQGLLQALDDGLLMATTGNRTSEPRQQSLRSTLEWSHRHLSERERKLLRRLSVFRGAFAAADAVSVGADDLLTAPEAIDALVSLSGKSLVLANATGSVVTYRLLRVTRAFAAEKLAEVNETGTMRRRHAEHFQAVFEAALTRWDVLSRQAWVDEFHRHIEDVRAALEWCFAPDGDLSVGGALTVAALPFGYQLSLIDEFKVRAQTALASIGETSDADVLVRLRLAIALGSILLNQATDSTQAEECVRLANDLAERIGMPKYAVEPLLVRAILEIEAGDYARAADTATALARMAAEHRDPLAALLAERVRAQAAHFVGDLASSRQIAEDVLRHPAQSIPIVYGQAPVDRRVSMRIVLARTAWLQGRPDLAARMVDECMEMALSDGPFAICQALALAGIPVALWRGDDALAEQRIELLLDYSERYTLDRWAHLGRCYQEVALRRASRGSPGSPVPVISECNPLGWLHEDLLISVDPTLIRPQATSRALEGRAGWCTAEILRARAEQLLAEGGESLSAADALLATAIASAVDQGAMSWELRCTMVLAEVRRQQGRADEGLVLLDGVLARFQEGRTTSDLAIAAGMRAEFAGEDGIVVFANENNGTPVISRRPAGISDSPRRPPAGHKAAESLNVGRVGRD